MTSKGLLAKTPEEIRAEKIRIWKNVIVISVGFLLQFMSFLSISALQSSINAENGLGTYSLTVIYVGLVFSSLFLVTLTIKHLTPKWTMVVCNLCYLGYTMAQFYPTFYTMMPSALLIGLAAAPLWSAKCTYISVVGKRYSELCDLQKAAGCKMAMEHKVDHDKQNPGMSHSAVVLFFGVFFATFHSAGVWGNLISSTVLSTGDKNSRLSDSEVSLCGKNFCEDVSHQVLNLLRPEEWRIQLISGIFVAIALCSATLIAVFLDPLSRFESDERIEEQPKKKSTELLMSTLKQMAEPRQALLTILVFYNGLERGFFDADFNKAFVGCVWGIENIGYVLMAGKAANSLGSVICGKVVKYTGRISLFGVAYVVNITGLMYLLLWEPKANDVLALFVMSGILSVSDALWGTQLNGLHGTIFGDNIEAAFSAYKVWESFGFIVAYFVSPLLCARVKLYWMLAILTAGIIGYFCMETLHFRRFRKSSSKK